MHDYSDVDAQLLIEVRLALHRGKPIPISLIRVLHARGWVHEAQEDEVISVRAALEDTPEETIERFSQELVVPNLTRTGTREIRMHREIFDDDLLEEAIGEDDELDGIEDEDDDGDGY